MEPRIIVGLGNPGAAYRKHRHNAGFQVVDLLAREAGIRMWRRTCRSRVGRGEILGRPVVLAQPQTFMNRSGEAVALLLGRYRADPAGLIVVHDDLDLEPGRIKIKQGGGHGGHNGLRSIVERCGPDFVRVRIGIGRPAPGEDAAAYVLRSPDDPAAARRAVERAAEAVRYLLEHTPAQTMNRFHA